MVTYTPGNVSKYLVMQNTLEETKRKYKEEIERLEKEVKKEREVELESVVAEVKATIKRYGLTARDLGLSTSAQGKPKAKSSKLPPKVVHPADGRTWSGRGAKPTWVSELDIDNTNL